MSQFKSAAAVVAASAVATIAAFEAMMARSDRKKGFFVSFDYSSDAMTEIGAFFRKSGRVIVLLTVREILDEQIAHKLA